MVSLRKKDLRRCGSARSQMTSSWINHMGPRSSDLRPQGEAEGRETEQAAGTEVMRPQAQGHLSLRSPGGRQVPWSPRVTANKRPWESGDEPLLLVTQSRLVVAAAQVIHTAPTLPGAWLGAAAPYSGGSLTHAGGVPPPDSWCWARLGLESGGLSGVGLGFPPFPVSVGGGLLPEVACLPCLTVAAVAVGASPAAPWSHAGSGDPCPRWP